MLSLLVIILQAKDGDSSIHLLTVCLKVRMSFSMKPLVIPLFLLIPFPPSMYYSQILLFLKILNQFTLHINKQKRSIPYPILKIFLLPPPLFLFPSSRNQHILNIDLSAMFTLLPLPLSQYHLILPHHMQI